MRDASGRTAAFIASMAWAADLERPGRHALRRRRRGRPAWSARPAATAPAARARRSGTPAAAPARSRTRRAAARAGRTCPASHTTGSRPSSHSTRGAPNSSVISHRDPPRQVTHSSAARTSAAARHVNPPRSRPSARGGCRVDWSSATVLACRFERTGSPRPTLRTRWPPDGLGQVQARRRQRRGHAIVELDERQRLPVGRDDAPGRRRQADRPRLPVHAAFGPSEPVDRVAHQNRKRRRRGEARVRGRESGAPRSGPLALSSMLTSGVSALRHGDGLQRRPRDRARGPDARDRRVDAVEDRM